MPKGKGWDRGESHYKAKQPDAVVRVCRERYLTGRYSYADLAHEFGVPLFTVRDWVTYRTRINA